MPRIQILQLPEGAADERPPFVLVLDQVPRDEPAFTAFREDLDAIDKVAKSTGARAVLCFEETIEIPSNDVSAYATGPVTDVHFDVPPFASPSGDELAQAVKRNLGSSPC